MSINQKGRKQEAPTFFKNLHKATIIVTVALLSMLGTRFAHSQNIKTETQKAKLQLPGALASRGFSRLPDNLQVPGCEACGQMSVLSSDSFLMGSPSNESGRLDREGPQHYVSVQPFEIGRTEVTQAQWKAVMGFGIPEFFENLSFANPMAIVGQVRKVLARNNMSRFKSCGDACPVDFISWSDTQVFIRKLNEKTGLAYRLPTEAEWEFAARAGSRNPFSWGSTIDPQRANYNGTYAYDGAGKGAFRQTTVRVDEFEPNSLGLYNMHGNVWEWVQDCWNSNYTNAPNGSNAWLNGDCAQRIMRGGSWIDTPANLRSAFRTKDAVAERFSYHGFRLARSLP